MGERSAQSCPGGAATFRPGDGVDETYAKELASNVPHLLNNVTIYLINLSMTEKMNAIRSMMVS